MSTAIKFENISKQYRLGLVSTNTISHDLNRWWQMNIRGKEDPYLKIGETNDRAHKGNSDYVWALKDINFEVEQGDVLGIIGKNGAGKSTLLKILSKVTTPTTGCIKAKGRIASLLEVGTGFHPELTGRENIYMNGAILGMSRAEIAAKLDEIIDFSGCERYIDTPTKRYSSGMTVRLGFAIAAHLDPEILVVDEVLAVGDAEFQKKAIGKMQDVSRGQGRTVLFVSHNMLSVKSLCSNGLILSNGTVDYFGDIDNCIVRYLGNIKSDFISYAQVCNSKHRPFGTIYTKLEFEFLEVSLENEDPSKLATDEPLSLLFKIKQNDKSVTQFNLNIHIRDGFDAVVGTFQSDGIDLIRNLGEIFELRLILKNHNLAKGRYKLDFNLTVNKPDPKCADSIAGVILFEVMYLKYLTKEPGLSWSTNWGSFRLKEADLSFC